MNELWIYDVIGAGFFDEGLTAKTVRDEIEKLGKVDEITVRINSPGGDVFEAVAIKALLDNHPAKISVKVDGLSASAATMIQMAGDEIELADGSMVMIHEPWGVTVGDEADHTAQASALGKIGENIAAMYASKGKRSAEEFRDLMLAETWLSADEAIDAGLADKLSDASAKACKVPSEFGYKNAPNSKDKGRAPTKLSIAAMSRKIDLTRRGAKL